MVFTCALTALAVAMLDSAPGLYAGRRPDSAEMLLIPFSLTYASAFVGHLLTALALSGVARPEESSRRAALAVAASVLVLVGSAFGVRLLQTGFRGWRNVVLSALAALVLGTVGARLAYALGAKGGRAIRLTESPWFRLVGALCLLVGLLSPIAGALSQTQTRFPPVKPLPASRPPRIILISADTLRRDHVSCYPGAATATPNLERLCRNAMVFDAARAASPWTLPTFASIMTGVSPAVHRATRTTSMVPSTLPRLAQVLHDAGYRTRAVVANNFLRPERKLSQGFQEYTFSLPRWNLASAAGRRVWTRLFPKLLPVDGSTDDLTDRAIRVLEDDRDVPLFLWLHYLDPHMPYTPPLRYLDAAKAAPRIGNFFAKRRGEEIRAGFLVPDLEERAWIGRLYAGEVRYVDENIGRLLDALQRLGLYEDSLVVFTSDHGEEFWEHGGFEHGHTFYDELLRVPLVVKLPGAHGEVRIDTPVPLQDVAATILDVAGIEHGAFPPSASLRRFWQSDGGQPVQPLFVSTGAAFYEDRLAIVFGNYKFIRWLVSGREELYDLHADPQERQSITNLAPDVLAHARELAKAATADAARERDRYRLSEAGETARVDEATREQLRQLGYER